jgi:hypothetical protein
VKICKTCKVEKNLSEFYKYSRLKDQAYPHCKICTAIKNKEWYAANKERHATMSASWYKKNKTKANQKQQDWHYKSRYGVSYKKFLETAKAQNNQCAICSVDLVFDKNCKERAVLDHDHDTGENRGVLCNACNTGVGLLKDSAVVLTKAASYLTKHSKG